LKEQPVPANKALLRRAAPMSLALVLAACAPALPAADHQDVAYASLSPSQTLDLYLPSPKPCSQRGSR
jgi:hypothetical protein